MRDPITLRDSFVICCNAVFVKSCRLSFRVAAGVSSPVNRSHRYARQRVDGAAELQSINRPQPRQHAVSVRGLGTRKSPVRVVYVVRKLFRGFAVRPARTFAFLACTGRKSAPVVASPTDIKSHSFFQKCVLPLDSRFAAHPAPRRSPTPK